MSILEKEPEIKDALNAVAAPSFRGEIVFDKVGFSYNPKEPVLDKVSFKLKPGQIGALVGPSGIGKSTIASLLLRFYDPQNGCILIDGTDLRRYTLSSLRSQISVVLQESVLFGTTIRENIAYGKIDAPMEEIVAAAKAANAHEFITRLSNEYDTVIGERGCTLSGGQRQRIAIARAIIRNAPILILDEPMIGLDNESKSKVWEAVNRLIVGKTCLFITHDLNALAKVDLVLVMDKNRIIVRNEENDVKFTSLGKDQPFGSQDRPAQEEEVFLKEDIT